jgi:hypothetical protein
VNVILTGGLSAQTSISTNADVTAQSYLQAGTYMTAPNIYSGTVLHAYGTADSVSTSTGSLIVDGGAGIKAQLNVGLGASITGDTLIKRNSSNYTTLSTDASGNFYMTATGTTIFTPATNIVHVQSIADSTSVASGALKVEGGMAVKNRIHVGNQIILHNSQDTSKIVTHGCDTDGNGTITAGGTKITIANTTNSGGTSSGALVIAGGLGVANTLSVKDLTLFGGTVNVNNVSFISPNGRLNITELSIIFLAASLVTM